MNIIQSKQLESNNLKVLSDQITYESLLNKKFSDYANMCSDQSLKTLCTEASMLHKQNFTNLKTYLDSHQ